jgi:hypothetical protein
MTSLTNLSCRSRLPTSCRLARQDYPVAHWMPVRFAHRRVVHQVALPPLARFVCWLFPRGLRRGFLPRYLPRFLQDRRRADRQVVRQRRQEHLTDRCLSRPPPDCRRWCPLRRLLAAPVHSPPHLALLAPRHRHCRCHPGYWRADQRSPLRRRRRRHCSLHNRRACHRTLRPHLRQLVVHPHEHRPVRPDCRLGLWLAQHQGRSNYQFPCPCRLLTRGHHSRHPLILCRSPGHCPMCYWRPVPAPRRQNLSLLGRRRRSHRLHSPLPVRRNQPRSRHRLTRYLAQSLAPRLTCHCRGSP